MLVISARGREMRSVLFCISVFVSQIAFHGNLKAALVAMHGVIRKYIEDLWLAQLLIVM